MFGVRPRVDEIGRSTNPYEKRHSLNPLQDGTRMTIFILVDTSDVRLLK